MRLCLLVLAGLLAACAAVASPQPTKRTPQRPPSANALHEGNRVAQVARGSCVAELAVLRRCVNPSLSPGEPYLLHHDEGLRIIFRKAGVDRFGSLIRPPGAEDRWVVDDAPDVVRRDILEHATFSVACDRLPPDGVYFLDLCPLSVPPDACASRVTATAATVVEIERAGQRPLRQRPGLLPIQVSLSPDLTHPKCNFDPYSGPIHHDAR